MISNSFQSASWQSRQSESCWGILLFTSYIYQWKVKSPSLWFHRNSATFSGSSLLSSSTSSIWGIMLPLHLSNTVGYKKYILRTERNIFFRDSVTECSPWLSCIIQAAFNAQRHTSLWLPSAWINGTHHHAPQNLLLFSDFQ